MEIRGRFSFMAKKAQVVAKAKAKAVTKSGAKGPVKGKTQPPPKKVSKAPASPKAVPAKTSKVVASVKKVAPPVQTKAPAVSEKPGVSKKTIPAILDKKVAVAPIPPGKKAADDTLKPAPKSKAERAAKAAETSEKIKIDKMMSEDQAKWAEFYNKYKDTPAANYDMKATFAAATSIQHKVLGWGWITSNENDRLEVYFKDGKRMLISNYRG